MPSSGAGTTWWMIDVLKFDESFQAKLSLVSYALTLVGMFALRRFMAEKSIASQSSWARLFGELVAGLTVTLGDEQVTLDMALSRLLGGDREERRR